jgi:transcriptional regulator with XRE-family HTH domain
LRALFVPLTFRAPKPRPGYPADPQTLAEHLRKRRLDLSQTQGEAACAVGVSKKTYEYWEQGRTKEVAVRYLPAVITFLSYDPTPKASGGLGERIRAARRRLGISQEELAARLGLDPSTVIAWERGRVRQEWPRVKALFERFVEE